LSLEVHPHDHQYLASAVVGFLVVNPKHNHPNGDGAVERIEGRLVLHDEGPAVDCEVLDGQIQAKSVEQLPTFRLAKQISSLSPVHTSSELLKKNRSSGETCYLEGCLEE